VHPTLIRQRRISSGPTNSTGKSKLLLEDRRSKRRTENGNLNFQPGRRLERLHRDAANPLALTGTQSLLELCKQEPHERFHWSTDKEESQPENAMPEDDRHACTKHARCVENLPCIRPRTQARMLSRNSYLGRTDCVSKAAL
jgi:hypothetical protein